jgi:hypothetical protein
MWVHRDEGQAFHAGADEYVIESTHAAVIAERDALRAENEKLKAKLRRWSDAQFENNLVTRW